MADQLMDHDRITPRSLNTDKTPEELQGGEVLEINDLRFYDNTRNTIGVGKYIPGMFDTLMNTTYKQVGFHEDIQANTGIYFMVNPDGGENLIYRYYPKLIGDPSAMQLLMRGTLGFTVDSVITGTSVVDRFLGWTDGVNTGRLIDMDLANRTGKKIRFSLRFGIAEPGVNDIFVPGTTYSFNAYDNTGGLLVNFDWTTTDPALENNLLAGATAYCAAFNAGAAATYFTAKVCGCGEVEVEELTASGTADGHITQATFESDGAAPVMLVYENIYPDNIDFFNIWRLKCPPNYAPVAQYKTDTVTAVNAVQQNVFKFQYRYYFRDGFKSKWSPISDIPMDNYSCLSQVASSNNYIDVDFTGKDDWLKDPNYVCEITYVEIGVRIGADALLQSVVIIPPCEWGIHRSWYNFYNTQTLVGLDPTESDALFDNVPLTHQAETNITPANMEGTRAILGNITEGRDNICLNTTLTTNYVEQEVCQDLHTVTFDIFVENLFAAGDGLYQGIWQKDDMDYPVYGGLSDTILGVTDLVNGMDSQYLQVIPEGGFTVYLAGTDYMGISVQQDLPLPKQNITRNVYDVTTNAMRNNVRTVFVAGVGSTVTISGLKPGSYVARVASPYVSFGDKLGKGSYFDLNNGRKYQLTSAPVLRTDNGHGGLQDAYEISFTINAGDPPVINEGAFYILDPTDVRVGLYSCVSYGYLIDGLGGTDDPELLNKGLRVEYQEPYVLANAGVYDIQAAARTDHNGFWWVAFGGLTVAIALEGKLSFPLNTAGEDAKGLYEKQYEGTLGDLESGVALTKEKYITHGGTGDAKFYIVYVTNADLRPQYSTSLVGRIVDSDGHPVQGILVSPRYVGRQEYTDSNGEFNIVFYEQKSPYTRFSALLSTGSQCCVELPTLNEGYGYWQNDITNPINPPYNASEYYDVGTWVATIESTSVISIWKRGGRRQFGRLYKDNGNRSNTIQTDNDLIVFIPFWTEYFGTSPAQDFGIPVISYEINDLPPDWAEEWSWAVTDDFAYSKYIQIVTAKIQYMVYYNSSTDFEETSYSSNTATQIWISLSAITNFNNYYPNSTVGYTYEAGDRLRFIKDPSGKYVKQYIDVPILGQFGEFIAIEAMNEFPEITKGFLIEIYHQGESSGTSALYHEFGGWFPIYESGGVKYHSMGSSNPLLPLFTPQDQTASQPATGVFPYGDTWWHARRMTTRVQGSQVWTNQVESMYLSDFFPSNVLNYGRPNVFDPYAVQKTIETGLRYSNIYRQNTNINGLNEFEAGNYTLMPQSAGAITKLAFVNNILAILGKNELISAYTGMGIITEPAGGQTLTITNNVIGQFRILGSKDGCENPESVCMAGDALYWFNRRKGAFMQYASNAPFAISDKGKRNFFLQAIDGLTAGSLVCVAHNYRYKEIQVTIGINGDYTTLVYNYAADAWTHTLNFIPQYVGQTIYGVTAYNTGNGIWQEDMNVGDPNNYFGLGFTAPSLRLVFNKFPDIEKSWASLGVECLYGDENTPTEIFTVPNNGISVYTSDGSLQRSALSKGNFQKKNSEWRAPFLRNVNSPGVSQPLFNGQKLRGRYMEVLIRCLNENPDLRLFAITGYFTGSPRSAE